MKQIKLSTDALLAALKKIKPAISASPVIPLIGMVYVSTRNNEVIFTATDLQLRIVSTVACECEGGIGFCVELKPLLKVAEALPVSQMVMEYDAASNELSILCDGAKFELHVEPVDEYPAPPDVGEVITQRDMDKDIVDDCANALKFVSTDELRPAMTGVCFEYTTKSLQIIATDAYMLYVSGKYSGSSPRSFIVPATAMKIICGVSKKTYGTLSFTETHCLFECGDLVVISRLVDADFPDYTKIVPDVSTYFSLNRSSLMSAAKSMLPFASKYTSQLIMSVNGNVKLEVEDVDYEMSATKEIELKYKNIETEFVIAFNAVLLLVALSAMNTKNIRLHTTGDAHKAVVIKGNDTDQLVLIMPLHIEE